MRRALLADEDELRRIEASFSFPEWVGRLEGRVGRSTAKFLVDLLCQTRDASSVEGVVGMIEAFEAFDYEQWSTAPGGTRMSLDLFVDGLTTTEVSKILRRREYEGETCAVGVGEAFFRCMAPVEPSRRGDFALCGRVYDLKGREGKLASQGSHASPLSIRSRMEDVLRRCARSPYTPLLTINAKSLRDHYEAVFPTRRDAVAFLRGLFSALALHASEGDFDYVDDCVAPSGRIDVDALARAQALFEYDYFRSVEPVDVVTFVDPDTADAVRVDCRGHVERALEEGSLSAKIDVQFGSDRSRAIQWIIPRRTANT